MTNNPLNGYQPEYADAITDAQEHNIEHAQAMQGDGNADSLALPTCRFCGRQILPVDKPARRSGERSGNTTMRLPTSPRISSGTRTGGKARKEHQKIAQSP